MRYFPLFAALYVKFADSLPDDYLSPGTEQISGALGVQPTTDAGAAKIDSFGTGDSLALLQTTPGDPDLQLDGIKAVEGCKPQSDPGANKKRQAYIPNLCYPSQNQGVPPPSSIETTPPIIPEILNPEFPDIFAKPAKPPQRAPPGPIPYHPPIIKNENNPLIESGGDTRRCSSQVLTLCCWGPKHITDIYYCVKFTFTYLYWGGVCENPARLACCTALDNSFLMRFEPADAPRTGINCEILFPELGWFDKPDSELGPPPDAVWPGGGGRGPF